MAGGNPFSRQTLIDVTTDFKHRRDEDLTEFCLRFGLEDRIPPEEYPLGHRLTALQKLLIFEPQLQGPLGGNLQAEIVDYLVAKYWREGNPTTFEERHSLLVTSLRHDGFVIEYGKVTPLFPKELAVQEKENELVEMLKTPELAVARNHLDQALSAFRRGEWESSNGQLRTFVEALFNAFADKIAPKSVGFQSIDRWQAMSTGTDPFFLPELNEWLSVGKDAGKGFVQGFWKRLHPKGPHPGMSEPDEATFRLHLVLLISHHFLKRFLARS